MIMFKKIVPKVILEITTKNKTKNYEASGRNYH